MCQRAITLVRELIRSIHLEPIVFLFSMTIKMTQIPGQELYVQKVCQVDLGHTQSVCNNLANHTHIQIETQKLVSSLQGLNGFLQSIPAVLVALVAGPMADHHSKKPLLILTNIGYLLLAVVYLTNCWWFHHLPASFLLFECVQDVTGGDLVMMAGVHAILADTIPREQRTRRFAIIDFFMYVGWMAGFKSGVALKDNLGWIALFGCNILIIGINVICIQFLVREKEKEREEAKLGLKDIIRTTVSSFRSLLSPHSSGRLPILILLFLVLLLFQFAGFGPNNLWYIFRKIQYKITLSQYANLSIFTACRSFLTNLIILPILTTYVSDSQLIIISIIGSIIGNIIAAVGDNFFFLYLASGTFMFFMSTGTITRSLISKIVEENEITTAFAVHGILAKVTDMVSYPCFSAIYTATVDILPGMFALVCAGVYVVILIIMIIVHIIIKRTELNKERNKVDTN